MRGSQQEAVDALWQRLWAGGQTRPVLAIEQVSYLLLLKRISLYPISTSVHPFYGHARLKWQSLKEVDPRRGLKFLQKDLIALLQKAAGPSVEEALRGASFTLGSASLLADCMVLIDQLGFEDEGPEFGGAVLDALIDRLELTGKDGHRVTPRPLIAAMTEIVSPQRREVIADPAVGMAGFLSEAFTAVGRGSEQAPNSSQFFGLDTDPTMVRIAAVSLFLHGAERPRVRLADSLRTQLDHTADVVMCNPPFGKDVEGPNVPDGLVLDTKRTELLFMERCRRMLKPGGRVAIVVPQAVLFGQSPSHVKVRRRWLTECRLEAVISLPIGLESGSDLRAAVLFASAQGETQSVIFCPLEDLEELEPAAALAALPHALRCVLAGKEPDEEPALSIARSCWSTSVEEIAAREYSLLPEGHQQLDLPRVPDADPLDLLKEVEGLENQLLRQLTKARELLSPE